VRQPVAWQQDFLHRHRLPAAYLDEAVHYADPIAAQWLSLAASRPAPIVAINGTQGSGKTTLCDYFATRLRQLHACRVAVLSLDDFYLTRSQRVELAARVHPLFATRGLPGTHDMALLSHTLDRLQSASACERIDIPRFDKSRDERSPAGSEDFVGRADLILLEGWCLGARPQDCVEPPVNRLEAEEDPDTIWRHAVNEALRRDFLPLYARVDRWLMLRAPDFECVYRWRREQEHKLAATLPAGAADTRVMSDAELARFIAHYERLTRHCLAELPARVNVCLQLDSERRVVGSRCAGPAG
jgi:D-glycerate 3-kinase